MAIAAGATALFACGGSSSGEGGTTNNDSNQPSQFSSTEELLASLTFPEKPALQKQASFKANSLDRFHNVEAVIPPQCYTKHEKKYNPCMTCHQNYPLGSRPNAMNDGKLQEEYAFSEVGVFNKWVNLFEDRSERIKKISHQEVVDYIYTDNYTPLIKALENDATYQGPIPKINNLQLGAEAFDNLGFAKDGSQWVAFNYKPFPSTFWPTNGSTDDVIVRLPKPFRQACGSDAENKAAYITNLSIMEMSVKDLATISTPQIDENAVCTDLNGDGQLTKVTSIAARDSYIGGASSIKTHKMLYPKGVEFIHTVRYVGINKTGGITIPPRLKELRYMQKTSFMSEAALSSAYGNERQEKIEGNLPSYVIRPEKGTNNNFGWVVHGFIENKDGSLRQQNQEETYFCMGCHTTIGNTIDQTFAFPRKVTGAGGWGYINLKGMKDAPNVGKTDGEILNYLRTVGGGDEFRQNTEMMQRWFDTSGNLLSDKVIKADVEALITPSVERALDLNKAYMTIVADQDFTHGRDANITPATNIYKEVDGQIAPVLPKDKTQAFDIRLNWE